MHLNWLDRAIAVVNPQAGLKRAMARSALTAIDDRYNAAKIDRGFNDWLSSSSDVNTVVAGDIVRIRNRCRDLGRNDPYISRAYDMIVAKMVGTGIRPRLPGNVPKQTRERTMDSWKRWVDEADLDGLQDLYGLQVQAARTMVESGMALIRFIPDNNPTIRIPWRVQVLEPDFLDLDRNQRLDGGGEIVNGVEFNANGRRTAYWLFPEHPGNGLYISRNGSLRIESQYVAPLYRATRPDQVIGVPWAAPVVMKARHLDDLNDARVKRAKIQACFAAFITKGDPAAIGPTAVGLDGRRREQISPGMIDYLAPGEEISFASPPSGEGDDEWQKTMLHAIATGVGATYSQVTGDLSQTNYSSMRAGSIDQWALMDQWQHIVLKPMMLNPMWRVFDRIEGTLQRRNDVLSVEWDFPERPLVDPKSDGEAIDAALLAGRRTFKEVISATGKDPEMHIAELRRELEEYADLGLPHLMPEGARPANGDQNSGTEPVDEPSEALV